MPKKKTASSTTRSFAEQFEELERIVTLFESGKLDVDESLKYFEKGLQLAEQLKKQLESVEQHVTSLKRKYTVDEE